MIARENTAEKHNIKQKSVDILVAAWQRASSVFGGCMAASTLCILGVVSRRILY